MSSSFPSPPFITPCGSTTPPSLPPKFHAIALLTPFNDSQLVVADIYYDWSVQAMRVTTYGLERGYADFLYTPDGYYLLDSENGGAPQQCFGPIATTEQVPAPNWLVSYQATCNGVQEVLGVNTNWWCGLTQNTNGLAPFPPVKECPPYESANWFWLRADNQMPWRMMFINTTNDYKLPFIGRFAFVHFPTFEAVTSTDLPSIMQSCIAQSDKVDPEVVASLQIERPEDTYDLVSQKPFPTRDVDQANILGNIQKLIPGLTPPDNNTLPSWPPTLFMTALTTPTFEPHSFANQPYPTQVFYDWPNQRQLTRFFLPDNSLEDVILTATTSYLIARFSDGTYKCLGIVPVGLPYTNWPTRAGGTCKGVITNNPQLSPDKTTQIFALNSEPPRFFWIWYTTANQAIMFAEVPQACNVELVLTDYFDYMPGPPSFDPSLFVVPPDCLGDPQSSVASQIEEP